MSDSTITIPRTQRAGVINKYGSIDIQTDWPVVQPSELAPGQCLIRISMSGVCHSDFHIKNGEWPTRPLPLVGGHEGVGTVVALAAGTPGTDAVKVGSRVGIKWTAYACGQCETCRTGYEPVCKQAKASGHILHGTFCEYAVGFVNHVVPIPDGLEDEITAPALCAGVTVYRGLKVSNTKVGDWVVIPGAGGGLGHMAVQYAVAMGLRVVAIGNYLDTGDDKKEISLKNGAEEWIDFKQTSNIVQDVIKICDGLGAHAAVVTSPVSQVYDDALQYLRPAGTLVIIAMPAGVTMKTPVNYIVSKSLKIVGSAVGNLQDAIEAVALVKRKKVTTHVRVRKLEEINDIFQEMDEGKLVGRAVIQLS